MMLQKRGLMGGGGGVDWKGQTAFDLEAVAGTTYEIYDITAPSGTLIDWGDGTITQYTSRSHSYAQNGTYIVKIGAAATYVRINWGSTTLGAAIRHIYNIGESIGSIRYFCGGATGLLSVSTQSSPRLTTGTSTTDNRAFYNCTSLQSVVFNDYMLENLGATYSMFEGCTSISHVNLGARACANANRFEKMFEYCSSLTEISIPTGFASSTTYNSESVFGHSALKHLVLPDHAFEHCEIYGGWSGTVNLMYNLESFTAGEGFGAAATNIAYFLAYHFDGAKLSSVSLPSGFGANATAAATNIFNKCTMLTDLTMHGVANGIKVSLYIPQCPLATASVISLMTSLQSVETTQTLTLKSSLRSTYEASADYIAARDALTARGWAVAFA